MSNYKDYKDAYMVCLRALFDDVLTLDEETFALLDASFASVEMMVIIFVQKVLNVGCRCSCLIFMVLSYPERILQRMYMM